MAKYSKLIAGILGNIVAILIAFVAFQFPALTECRPTTLDITAAIDQVCTIFGFGQAQITAALMVAVNALFIERAPANTK